MARCRTMSRVQIDSDDWGTYEDATYWWDRIEMREFVYTELPEGSVDAIEQLVRVSDAQAAQLVSVKKRDAETIELHWYDDAGEADRPKDEYGSYERYERAKTATRVGGQVVDAVEDLVHGYYGEQWRVNRLPDQRHPRDVHPQKVIIRRVEAQRFKYRSESEDHYKMMLEGQPEFAPEGVTRFGELDEIADPHPPVGKHSPLRGLHVHISSTGTFHLIEDLHDEHISTDVRTVCGSRLDPQAIVDGHVYHYGEVLGMADPAAYGAENKIATRGPKYVLPALCKRCWKGYAEEVPYNNTLEHPVSSYGSLVDDDEQFIGDKDD